MEEPKEPQVPELTGKHRFEGSSRAAAYSSKWEPGLKNHDKLEALMDQHQMRPFYMQRIVAHRDEGLALPEATRRARRDVVHEIARLRNLEADKLEDSQGEKVVPATTRPKKGQLESVAWVAEVIEKIRQVGLDPHSEDFGPKASKFNPPSGESVGLLRWVLSSPGNQETFWSSIWVKMLPSRSQIETEARFRDDGRQVFRVLEMYDQAQSGGTVEQGG